MRLTTHFMVYVYGRGFVLWIPLPFVKIKIAFALHWFLVEFAKVEVVLCSGEGLKKRNTFNVSGLDLLWEDLYTPM